MFWSKKQDEPKTLGQIGEEYAAWDYQRRGYKIVAANFFNKKGLRKGEIDLIAVNRENIVFVEVKTRTQKIGYQGTPLEAVDYFKQIKLLKAAKLFLLSNPKYTSLKPGIDVFALVIEDFSPLLLAQDKPAKYLVKLPFDKFRCYVKIIPNAVEDWN